MKKLFLLFIVLSLGIDSYAQVHLKFKGVEIDGNYQIFVGSLLRKGCERGENAYGISLIKANFAGIEMMVYPQTTSQSKTVYAVVAGTEEIEELASMRAQYDELKNLLSQKYGAGVETTISDGWYRNSINKLVRGTHKRPYFLMQKTAKYTYMFINTIITKPVVSIFNTLTKITKH